MNRISGAHSAKPLMKSKANLLSIEDILPGSYYACRYDKDWYFGVANYVSVEHSDVNVKFLHPKGPASQLFWPNMDDICWIPIEDIIAKVDPPTSSSTTGRFYQFSCEDVEKVLHS